MPVASPTRPAPSDYDAFYGTDVIPEDDGASRAGPYNPVRGERVIARVRELLDDYLSDQGYAVVSADSAAAA